MCIYNKHTSKFLWILGLIHSVYALSFSFQNIFQIFLFLCIDKSKSLTKNGSEIMHGYYIMFLMIVVVEISEIMA